MMKILDECRISPPANSVPSTQIPLTFFDIDFLYVPPAQSVFLYRFPFGVAKFTEEILPQLKNSLAWTLQRFFIFSGNCVCPPQPSEPYIFYKEGDSIPFLVTPCDNNFSGLLGYEPIDAKQFRPLVPATLPMHVVDNDTLMGLLSVQVTLFPNSGICFGITNHHVAADGMSLIHFVKTWVSIFKAKCNMSSVSIRLPIHDKGYIKDPEGIKKFRLNQWRAMGSPMCNEAVPLNKDRVRALLTMSRFDIDRLKKWISAKSVLKLNLSSFVVICAFIWVCLIKTLDLIKNDLLKDEHELCHFVVIADCRNKPGMGIPATFFGNCLTGKLISVARSKFRQEDCIATVAETLSHSVQSLKTLEVGMDLNEFPKWEEAFAKMENIQTVTSTPRQAAYETDFGWGRPEKIEAVHIDTSGSISLTQSRNEEGGIEIGLCRSKHEMEVFTSIFEEGINKYRYRVML